MGSRRVGHSWATERNTTPTLDDEVIAVNRKDSHSLTGDYFPTSVLREAECNWGLASFKPWFGRSLAMCLRANHLISLNLFVFFCFFFHLRSGSGMMWCMSHACSMHCTVRSYAPSTWKLTDVSLGSQGWLSLWSKADTCAPGPIVLTFFDSTLAYGTVS